jgi:hypothetical protein
MRQKFLLVVVVFFVCLFSASAQTVSESESSIVFSDKTANVSIVIVNQGEKFDGPVELELLDGESKVRANITQNLTVKKGRETYKIALPIGDLLQTEEDKIAWFRLRYRVGNQAGIIALSGLLKDVFELRIAAGESVLSGMNYRVRVRSLQPFTKSPVKDVKLEGELTFDLDTDKDEDELKIKATGETDDEGFAVLDFKIPENAKLDDDGDLKITGRKNGIVREFDNDELQTPTTKGALFLTADKPLYQPGQSFNVRALYFDANSTVVPDSELNFTVKDEEDTVLYRETVKTSAYGVASIAWKIPDNAKLGAYHVEVDADDELDGNRLEFKVSRYDLPQFSVAAKPDKTFYLPTDRQAEITVRADYLFGKPVTRGKVRVVQENDRHWNWRAQKYEAEEKQTFEGATDAEGKYIAKVDLSQPLADLQESGWVRFNDLHFAAYFTDLTTNRTEQRRFDVRLSKEPIHIYFIGKHDGLSQNLPITAYVSTFYADGTPVVCDVEVEGKNNDNSADTFKTFERLKTNSLGAGKLEFMRPRSMDPSADLDLRIIARDAKGQTGTFSEELYYHEGTEGLKVETEKTIFKPGESVRVKLLSSKKNAIAYVDVVQNWSVLESRFVKLDGDGKGEIKIPYNPGFKGELTVAAYIDSDKKENYYNYYNLIKDSRGIIFPEQQNLKLDAQFTAATYKPNEEATVKFSVLDGGGKTVESALGIVIFDKAIEERAKTDADFGSYFSRFRGWLGYSKSFGGVTLKDLNELDLSKSVSPEIELAAEVMLADNYYYPRIYRSSDWETDAKSVYAGYFKTQLAALEAALKKQYEKDYAHPTDDASLRRILSANGVDFDALRDPWGTNYQATFTTDKTQNIITLTTAGTDKKFGTKDDFAVSSATFTYFTPIGKAIDKAVENYHRRTGGYIRDQQTLASELAKQDFDLAKIKDHWNRDYRIEFKVAGRNYQIVFRSLGVNGVYESYYYSSDDFEVWTSNIDYFAATDIAINKIFSQTVNGGKRPFPKDDTEFKQILKEGGLDLAHVKDGYGAPVYITFDKTSRYSDKTTIENGKQKITPVTEEVLTFRIRSSGGRYDGGGDFDLTTFSGVVSEQSKETKYQMKDVKTLAYSGANGAIRGTVIDPNGGVIPGATITATNENDKTTHTAVTKDDGTFLLENIPSGKYGIKIEAPGFKASVYTGIDVRSQNLVEMRTALEVGTVSETVSVTSEADVSINTSSSSASTNITSQQIAELPINGRSLSNFVLLKPKRESSILQTEENSTPRLREYFPETLVWSPELITDKNGKAELKFKMADNITTWKLYTIASTKNGKIGVTEKEVAAFQPFFADLEPPKFLTEGDEISLPVTIRNYTEKSQKVDVSMTENPWFKLFTAPKQSIDVASGDSGNAIFGFKAVAAIKDGKQRVTALAAKDSDAVEKPVTVRPNGQEIVRTESKFFRQGESFDINFPDNILPKTNKAELKIYPNLFSHVSESVKGLLERPYGCGEQTTSSTYPNLMILKFAGGTEGDGVTKGQSDDVKNITPSQSLKVSPAIREKAQKYLQKGYERLLGYQVADGGFSYWGGKDAADIALTAYVLRFLTDAQSFIEVDPAVVEKAENWLVKQQKADGSFAKKYYWETSEDAGRTKLFTSYVARTLALRAKTETRTTANVQNNAAALQKALGYLKTRNAEIDEPYALALYGLASFDAGNTEEAKAVAERLETMAIPEGSAVYWKLETNTPFYGWGTPGRIETTALVVQLLLKFQVSGSKFQDSSPRTQVSSPKSEVEDAKSQRSDLISKGMLFLLKNKDRYGVWYSTQTTINVLDTFLLALTDTKTAAQTDSIQILLNGETLRNITISSDKIEPVVIDLTGKLAAAANRVEIKSTSDSALMAQTVASHYIDWKDSDAANQTVNASRALRLDYKCDRQTAAIMQEINCSVEAERIGFKGYGMLLAEIGLPPGADVSRESLQASMDADWSLSRYDVLPDRIVLYMWSKAGGTKFNFKFKPRYGINALTPASTVYDYYNEEAKATVVPLRFDVK